MTIFFVIKWFKTIVWFPCKMRNFWKWIRNFPDRVFRVYFTKAENYWNCWSYWLRNNFVSFKSSRPIFSSKLRWLFFVRVSYKINRRVCRFFTMVKRRIRTFRLYEDAFVPFTMWTENKKNFQSFRSPRSNSKWTDSHWQQQ